MMAITVWPMAMMALFLVAELREPPTRGTGRW
jgi:hypothetical protein